MGKYDKHSKNDLIKHIEDLARTDDHVILARESWWKNTLGTRAFGLNSN